jgi:REP element-mobilizing transposase RayT
VQASAHNKDYINREGVNIKMTRIPRIHIEGALYYVTSRGDHSEEIFKDAEDYKMYLDLLKRYKEQYGFKLFSFALIPNHLHLLIELKEGVTISEIMHDLNSNYTKYFNGRYERKGHLFQERSKINLLEKSAYLLNMLTYIHLNPKVLNLVTEAKDYSYSSYPMYIGKRQEGYGLDMQNELQEVKGYLGQKNYADYILGISPQEMQNLAKALAKNAIMGSGEFMQKIESSVKQSSEPQEPKTEHRRFILVGSALVLFLLLLNFYLYTRTLSLKGTFRKELKAKEIELNTKLQEEKQKVVRDLEEKYQADRVSYGAMAKRLEIEKKRIKELEGKVK